MAILNNESGKYAANFVQDAAGAPVMDEAFKTLYDKFAQRICWIDGKVVPGAFQMNTAWYSAVPERDPIFGEHCHDDADELIGFIGSNPEDPYDLGAEIEVGINGELHRLTKSSMIFLPGGMKHLPLSIISLERPVLHFSISMAPVYTNKPTKSEE